MTELKKVTKNGIEHGLINVVANSVPFSDFKRFAEKDRENMRKLHKEDAKLVEAQYLNKNGQGYTLERPYCNWDGDPIQTWKFIHGETYTVPKGLISDVNAAHKIPKKRSDLLDTNGKFLEMDQKADPEHRFVAVGF